MSRKAQVTLAPLKREEWQGKRLDFVYESDGYFDFSSDGRHFAMTFKPFEKPQVKRFCDELFSSWLEAPVAFGAFCGEDLAGVIEGSMETWNNRFRISNLLVMEQARGQGIGTLLMARMLDAARESGARMAVLETQSCNPSAIRFYERCGFYVIGFDLFAYSNHDVEKGEVRVEMGHMLA